MPSAVFRIEEFYRATPSALISTHGGTYMHMYDIIESFAKAGRYVFTVYDVAKAMGKPVPYASLLLYKSKKVTRIERGKYFIDGATPYEIASNIVFPSYVSLQAGLRYYGLIEQNVVRYSVIALKKHNEVDLANISIEFIKARRELFFGYERKGNEFVATVEKLFIDCLYFSRVPQDVLEYAFNTALEEKLLDIDALHRYEERLTGIRGYATLHKRPEKLLRSGRKGALANWRGSFDLLYARLRLSWTRCFLLSQVAVGAANVAWKCRYTHVAVLPKGVNT